MAEIRAHCQQVFGEGDFKMTSEHIDPICIQASEIQQAIQKSQTGKAVPGDSVPVVVGKPCSDVLPSSFLDFQDLAIWKSVDVTPCSPVSQ